MAFSTGNSFVCSQCGKRIWGNKFQYENQSLCLHCYEALIKKENTQQEGSRDDLYNYIQGLFHQECPPEVSVAIEKWIKKGKKYTGIKYTLYYFYEILGNKPDSITLINWIIETQYDLARQHIADRNELKNINSQVQINIPPTIIKLHPNKKKNIHRNINYKMEDL